MAVEQHSGHRKSMLGAPIDDLTLSEVVDSVKSAICSGRRLQHVALNTAKLVNMRKDPLLQRDVVESDIVSPDGMGIVWGARLLGIPLRERVTGVDMMLELLALCDREGFRPFILGAAPDVLQQACAVIEARYPRLTIAGSHHGYFSEAETGEVVAKIRDAKADMLFVAMSTPRKEEFMHRYRDELGVPFLMGVGGTVDVIAGVVRRAPRWMQQSGLEWLYRTLQEPRRMWKRYLTTNAAFAWLMLQALLSPRPRTVHT